MVRKYLAYSFASVVYCFVVFVGIRDILKWVLWHIFGYSETIVYICDIIGLIAVPFVFESTRRKGDWKTFIKEELFKLTVNASD